MVKFNVSLLLAAIIAAPALAGYSPESGVYTTTETTSATTSGSASASTATEPPSTTNVDDAICEQEAEMPDTCDGSDGWYPVSVVGKEGYFCAKGPICAGEVGNCPGAHDDLVYGSKCVSISEGAYGCIPNTECPPTESTVVHDDCEVATDTPVTPGVSEETPYTPPETPEATTAPPVVDTPETKTAPPPVDTPETKTAPPAVTEETPYVPPETPETTAPPV
ncbi:hypothetical protein L915_00076, partial [Phytophthora nicotianae]